MRSDGGLCLFFPASLLPFPAFLRAVSAPVPTEAGRLARSSAKPVGVFHLRQRYGVGETKGATAEARQSCGQYGPTGA
jgi:hypothetical protein